MNREEYQRPSQEHGNKRNARNGHMYGQNVGHGLLDIIKYPAAGFYRLDNGREVVVQKHQR